MIGEIGGQAEEDAAGENSYVANLSLFTSIYLRFYDATCWSTNVNITGIYQIRMAESPR